MGAALLLLWSPLGSTSTERTSTTTTATKAGVEEITKADSEKATDSEGRSDTFAVGIFGLGAVLFAAGMGLALTFGGTSIKPAEAAVTSLAAAHTAALASGNAASIETTRDALGKAVETWARTSK